MLSTSVRVFGVRARPSGPLGVDGGESNEMPRRAATEKSARPSAAFVTTLPPHSMYETEAVGGTVEVLVTEKGSVVPWSPPNSRTWCASL